MSDYVSDELKLESLGTPHFYIQQKKKQERNPGRPVITSFKLPQVKNF